MKHPLFRAIILATIIASPTASGGPLSAQTANEKVIQVQVLPERTDIFSTDGNDSTLIHRAGLGVIPEDLLAPSPDERALAFVEVVDPVNFVTRLMLIRSSDSRAIELVAPDETGMPANPIWSPDGEKLAYIWVGATWLGFELRVLDLTTNHTHRLLGPEVFSVELIYGKSYSVAWELGSDALQFTHQHSKRTYRVRLNGDYEEAPETELAPEILRYLQVMRVGPDAPDYDGMTKPVSVRDYNATCGNGYTGLYPDYGGCVLTGPHPGVDMAWGATDIGCGTPVVAVCTGPIIRVEKYAYSGNGCANSYGGGYLNLGWQIVLRCDVPPAELGGVTYGGGWAYAVYAHLRQIEPDLAWGVWVPKGRVLGQVGSTGYSLGAHLHFQMEKNVTGLDASHPVYPKTYDSIAAYTWNPMYFIQAHLVQPPTSAPALVSPSSGSSSCDTTPTFIWNGVSGATSYRIQADNSSAFSSPEINQATSATSYTPSGGLVPGVYYWRVQASNSGGSGPWSTTHRVVILGIPSAPRLSTPRNDGAVCSITSTYSWSSVSAEVSYRIQVDDNSDFSSPVVNQATSNNFYTRATPTHLGQYYWRVRTNNTCGISAWSPAYRHSVIACSERLYLPITQKARATR